MKDENRRLGRRTLLRTSGAAIAAATGLGVVGTAAASHPRTGIRIVVRDTTAVWSYPYPIGSIIDGSPQPHRNTGEVVNTTTNKYDNWWVDVEWEQTGIEDGWVPWRDVSKL